MLASQQQYPGRSWVSRIVTWTVRLGRHEMPFENVPQTNCGWPRLRLQ